MIDGVPAFGVYLHIPFCATLCPYCDFAVVVGRPEAHERYCAALAEEARAGLPLPPAGSLFVGGGTPTFLDARLLARTIRDIADIVGLVPGAEVTVEANPDSVDAESLAALRDAGVNRLSIGAQSMDDPVLASLGRTHDAASVVNALDASRRAGFDNIGVDLIYGAASEGAQLWRRTLDTVVSFGVEHVSCYALTIEPKTAFGGAVARGKMAAPDDDVLADHYAQAVDVLGEAGFEHYEISNWAKPGRQCRHNLVYWTQGEYLGLGVGAHSHRGGARWWNGRSLARYVEDPSGARAGFERPGAREVAEEWLSLSIRLSDGVDLAEAERRLGQSLTAVVLSLTDAGLLRVVDGRGVLTTSGKLLENDVTLRLVCP
ncbi:MAG: radical SAM family heme chaperone HemW [Actinomycetota bacterium]